MLPATQYASPPPPPHLHQLDHLVARHDAALARVTAHLLPTYAADDPDRPELTRLIEGAFAAGLVDAYLQNQFAKPCGTPRQSQN